METIDGEGSLYNTDDKQNVTPVSYHIFYQPPAQFSFGEWWGSLKPINSQCFLELGEYTLQLKDKRSGKIIITRINVQTGLPYDYDFKGSGPIK